MIGYCFIERSDRHMIYSLRSGPALGPSRPNAYLAPSQANSAIGFRSPTSDSRRKSSIVFSQNSSAADFRGDHDNHVLIHCIPAMNRSQTLSSPLFWYSEPVPPSASAMEHKLQILLFGDQTNSFDKSLRRLLEPGSSSAVATLLERVNLALRLEIGALPISQQQRFPRFSSVSDLEARYRSSTRRASLESAFHCLNQLGWFIR